MTGPARVSTPAACRRRPTVAVLGAGIAGLTAAHELVERGFEVTVYEPRVDERAELGGPGAHPPVKLGGLAASQYATASPTGAGRARLRPFPGRRGRPCTPPRAVAGEHGFRFFPAYYLHIWDLLQRIPLCRPSQPGRARDRGESRTVMDNVRRMITQATILHGKPSLIIPREQPRNLAEQLTLIGLLGELGFTPGDVLTLAGRVLRYLVTSPLRRASELQNMSAYDFFIGRDTTAARRYHYSPQTEALILDMPKVLAAFDSRWGDARTNITTFLQLLLRMDRRDDKADGVLNGPTTEAWFDHWYRHLLDLGVRFVPGTAVRIEPPPAGPRLPPHRRGRVRVVLADGTRLAPDYVVAAVDAPAAERITAALRAAGTGGTVADLDGFATSAPPPAGPLQPAAQRPGGRRDPFVMAELGRVPWDRFQTLAGIQYYFDTEFQLVRGHVFYSGTEWGLSSINQHGLWEEQPTLARDGYVSVLSVDIGDFNTPSRHLLDEHGRGKAARDCTPDELAAEVWRQIAAALTSQLGQPPEAVVPWPAWYALDRNLVPAGAAGAAEGCPVRNEAPYLIPIAGDWPNRPGADPWNPNGTSWTTRPAEEAWLADLDGRAVWQARHGGYQVHHNSLVFAGTWTKTFTRMTTMEAACESARHAVNAILDHCIWVQTDGADRREGQTALLWLLPFGFLDQGFSVPVRQPSPVGDYCFVFDVENRETLETRALRNLDSQFCRAGLPHPLDLPTALPPIPGGSPMTTPNDYTGQLLSYLQAWRSYLEQAASAAAASSGWPAPPAPPAAWPVPPAPPPAWPVPPVPPPAAPPVTTSSGPPPYPLGPPPGPPGRAGRAEHGPLPPGPPVPPVAAGPPPAGSTWPAEAEPADPGRGRPAASAYSWVSDPAAATPPGRAAAGSLYADPAPEPPPPTWWRRTSVEEVPPAPGPTPSMQARPPVVRVPPLFREASFAAPMMPPRIAPALRLPGTRSPRAVRFVQGGVEITGADPPS